MHAGVNKLRPYQVIIISLMSLVETKSVFQLVELLLVHALEFVYVRLIEDLHIGNLQIQLWRYEVIVRQTNHKEGFNHCSLLTPLIVSVLLI